ncbi:MAG: T9SS type A sorting domain-containing protein, partial [candidate division WOR-3 bacterium]
LIKYDAGVPKTVELPVPPASYMNDGEIVMRITKIRGEFAMCHKGNLYEFEEEEQGGPQAVMSTPLNLEFGLKVLPNIFTHNTRIQYSVPTRQCIKLTVYDAAGRKVKTIVEGNADPGTYSYNLESSSLSSGVYFLVLKGEKESRNAKVLIVR